MSVMLECPESLCSTDVQPIAFEGRLSIVAGIAEHLRTVHGVQVQTSWRRASNTVAAARARARARDK